MAVSGDKFDVTKNIRMIEMLKAQLLRNVADLYKNLSYGSDNEEERLEILADMTIITYMLASRLGVSNMALDEKMKKKLRIGLLEENNNLHNDTAELLKFLNSR
ncbi:MAG: MazG-like family protein [Firmicutes bacterium]|nr:MazG-like family protein [Bacillota bacterium]